MPRSTGSRPASRSTVRRADGSRKCRTACADDDGSAASGPAGSPRRVVEKIIDAPRRLGADARRAGKVGERGALDLPQRSEMAQQGALAGRADAGNLLQSGLADVAPAAGAVRADREAMRLVAQSLHEIEHRVAQRQFEARPAGRMEGFATGVAVRTLGDGDERQVGEAERGQRLVRGAKLALAAVD